MDVGEFPLVGIKIFLKVRVRIHHYQMAARGKMGEIYSCIREKNKTFRRLVMVHVPCHSGSKYISVQAADQRNYLVLLL